MKNSTVAIFASLLLVAFVRDGSKNQKIFASLNKLDGTWQMQSSKGTLYENWITVDNKTMLGKTYRLKNGDTAFLEHVQLLLESGGIFYIPTTAGQNDEKPVRFRLNAAEKSSFTFENLEHDFPKRIVYHFVSADSIHAFIDDGKAGGERMDYYYGKVR